MPERLDAYLPMLREGDLFFFEAAGAAERGLELREAHRAATPFPHTVIDGFLPPALLDRVLETFPEPALARVAHTSQDQRLKRGYRPDDLGASPCRALLSVFQSAPFVQWVENVTGFAGLVPDPWFTGGGLHEIETGGRLEVHADFNLHPRLGLVRRVNVLVYLNRDWRAEYGGALELWDSRRRIRSIEPLYNRCVVFDTDRESFHGHPDPVRAPAGVPRRSIALYYYSAAAPAAEGPGLSRGTDWRRRGLLARLKRLLR